MINLQLAKERDISNADIMQIQLLHKERAAITQQMKDVDIEHEDANENLHYLGDLMAILESELQRLWGWEPDVSRTRFWELPHCTCPVLDNIDGMRVISGSCLVHGFEVV